MRTPITYKILLFLSSATLIFSIGLISFEGKFSLINRVQAWVSLSNNKYSSETEAFNKLGVLMALADPKPEEIVALAPKYNLDIKATTIDESSKIIEFTTLNENDPYFIEAYTYSNPIGSNGKQKILNNYLSLNGEKLLDYQQEAEIIENPINSTLYTGSKPVSEVNKLIEQDWAGLKDAITKKNTETINTFLIINDAKDTPTLLKIKDLSYKLTAKISFEITKGTEDNALVYVGKATLSQKGCNNSPQFDIIYEKATKAYKFSGVYLAFSKLCNKVVAPNYSTKGTTLTCTNCWLAPVNKIYGLKSSYVPYVVATGVTGGGFVTPATKTALQALFKDAQAQGLTPRVSSSYRSYTVQTNLFNSYVAMEQKNGLSYAKAVEKANTYSAKPGHSEHQLGTTVDILGCKTKCSFSNSENTPVYNFIAQNAHKYGFVISYPNGSQPYTGYVYEPWHIRYIGVDLATKLYNKGYLTKKGYYLNNLLLEIK